MTTRALILALAGTTLLACNEQKAAPPPPPAPPPPAAEAPPPPPPPAEAPPPAAADPAAQGGNGSIKGVVAFEGAVPAPTKLDMSKDPACGKINKEGTVAEVAVTDGKLADVFVYIKSGLKEGATFPARTDVPTLDQRGCIYVPLMIGLQTGQKVKIINSDPTLHNVHALAKRGEFNTAMPKKDSVIEKSFPKPEVPIEVKCEVHPWMKAHFGVVDHPFFAVTGADGSFTIEGVPAGKYTLELVHGKLGTQTVEVTVSSGAAAEAQASFKG